MTETRYRNEVRLLWQVAMAVFVVTIAIGLFNGQRVGQIDPAAERPLLLTHLHTGAIGWVTLSLFAAAVWLFTAGRSDDGADGVRSASRYAAFAVGLYPITFVLFYPGGPLSSAAALAVFGTAALVGIVWMLVWTIQQSRQVYMSVARLAVLGSLINLTLGAVLGVLIEMRFVGLTFPGNVSVGHPAMMTVGYLLPAAFTFVEWRLLGGIDGPRSKVGAVAIAMLVVGGWLAAFAGTTNQPALFAPILLIQIVATVILLVRVATALARTAWLSRTGDRHVAVAALAIPFDVGLLFYMVMAYFSQNLEPPRHMFIAIAHVEFVGMMTNAVFASILFATANRRDAVRPWTEDVVFWGVNVGWIGFVLAELTGAFSLVGLFTPIMGVALLIAIGTYAMRLSTPK